RVEDHVLRAKALFDPMPGLLPTDGDAALDDKIRVLDRARIAAYPEALRQVDDIHPVLAGWSTALAHIDQSGEPGIPHRLFFGITHDMPSELLLARIIAVGVEGASFPRRGPETAGGLRIAVAWVADIDRRLRHARADADRHQNRLDPVVAEAMRPAGLVQHHVSRPQARLDHLVTPRPADRQHTLQDEKMLDDLMRMTGGVLADGLMHQAQREPARFERVRVVGFGRAAGADIAHLRPLQFRETAASG